MASSSSPASRNPAGMSTWLIHSELREIKQHLKELQKLIDMEGPTWLYEPMTEDDAKQLVHDRARYGHPTMTYFLIEGPHYSNEFDELPEEQWTTPTGAIWYNLHTWSWDPALVRGATPMSRFRTIRINWTLDSTNPNVMGGYSYGGIGLTDIKSLGRTAFHDRDIYVPVEDADTFEMIRRVEIKIAQFSERQQELLVEFETVVTVLAIRGNGDLMPEIADVRVPRHIRGERVIDFINEVVSNVLPGGAINYPDQARVVFSDKIFTIVDTDMGYVAFKALLANSKRDKPLVEIIEIDLERANVRLEQESKRRKRHRTDTDGATALYAIGEDISRTDPRNLAVYMIADGTGLAVVDTDTRKFICEHVYEGVDIQALCTDQRKTGVACPLCQRERRTNTGV